MGSPDSEGTLEDDAPAQPGARAGEARDGDEEGLGKVARETCAEPVRTPERGVDPGGVADERIRSDDLGREERALHGGTDSLAGKVARESGSVSHQRESVAGEAAR